MMPVVLVTIPTTNRVIGTFDIDSFESWWLSEPFPGEIEDIIDVFWGHGDYHFAIAKMADGTWSLYRSNNCGRRWAEIWTSPDEIFGALKIDTTWYLISTAAGWFETTNTGATIEKVCDDVIGGGRGLPLGADLLYHDGATIWRSGNVGRDWVPIVDCDLVWSGLRSPAIAGNVLLALAGVGPVLLRSVDGGAHWTQAHRLPSDRIIRDILPLNGPAGAAGSFLVQVELLSESKFRYYVVSDLGETWLPRWDRTISPERTLTGYRVAVPVVGGEDELYFSGGSKFESSLGRYVPSLRWSRDGDHWTEIDLEATHTSPSTPFLIDQWTTRVWNGPPCHNWGDWIYTTHRRWGLSWDMSTRIRARRIHEAFGGAARVVNWVPGPVPVGAALRQTFPSSVPVSGALRKAIPYDMTIGVPVQASIPESAGSDAVLVLWTTLGVPVAPYLRKEVLSGINLHFGPQKEIGVGAGVGAFFVRSLFDSMLVDAEHYFPQWWNLHCPPRPWRVFNSKKERYD